MNKFKNFNELADDTLSKVLSFGITSKTVIGYFKSCVKELNIIMNQNNIIFSKNIALSWFENNNISCLSKRNGFRRTILLLSDNYDGILNEWKIYPSAHTLFPCSSCYASIINEYTSYLHDLDYRKQTIDFKIRCAVNLLIYLESLDITDINQLTHQTLSDYYTSNRFKNRKPGGVKAEILRTNHFIIYLENFYSLNPTLHFVAPPFYVKEAKIISTISDEIEKSILDDFPQFPTNLRNKAIYMLALRCGLRKIDIINLKFSDIDWENSLISILQIKTDIPLIIPMDNETSNAIIDYILNERKQCNINNIFITSLPPYRVLGTGSLNFLKRIRNIPEDKYPKEFGTHILRRTFASKLLKSGASLSIISSALGHEDKDRVNKYLSTDGESMKICALEIDDFPYKGGVIK